tara:strand:- start:37882 stop:38757 length:876 start_codon:yes stop_codon:yes gene_type:complete
MKNKSYLILGASSYLGFQMYKFLQKKNEKVTGTYYSAENNNENFERCNLLDRKKIDEFKKYDFVFLYSSVVAGKDKLKKNLQMIENVVNYVKKNNSLLIFISSSQVNFKFESEYKKSKIISEELIKKEVSNYLIVRPALVFGNPYEIKFKSSREQPLNVLKKIISYFRVVPIIGSGHQTRQPVYINDINYIIYKMLQLDIYNKTIEIGGPEIITFKRLIEIFASKLNKKILKIHVPLFILYPFAYFFKFIDLENLRNLLSSEVLDNNSWRLLHSDFQSMELKNFNELNTEK